MKALPWLMIKLQLILFQDYFTQISDFIEWPFCFSFYISHPFSRLFGVSLTSHDFWMKAAPWLKHCARRGKSTTLFVSRIFHSKCYPYRMTFFCCFIFIIPYSAFHFQAYKPFRRKGVATFVHETLWMKANIGNDVNIENRS